VLVQPVVRRDDQLLAVARELRRHVVDAHGMHIEALQVEVEAPSVCVARAVISASPPRWSVAGS